MHDFCRARHDLREDIPVKSGNIDFDDDRLFFIIVQQSYCAAFSQTVHSATEL